VVPDQLVKNSEQSFMTGDILLVFGLLLVTILLFVSDRLRMDIVAILAVLALMLSGLLAPKEALAGFGDPLVVLIAGLFVIGEGLFRTGVAFAIGNWLLAVAGSSETRLLVLLMLVVAGLSAFMSNTGAVAVFIPVALNLSKKAGVPATRLLMPMAFAGSLGGMLTLIGTPPNLVVSNQLSREGLQAFNFFSFTPLGLLILVATIIFISVLGRFLLPKDGGPGANAQDRLSVDDLIKTYAIDNQLFRLRIESGSPLLGQTLGQALLQSRFGVIVVAVSRPSQGDAAVKPALVHTEYRAGDTLYLVATEQQVGDLLRTVEGLQRLSVEAQQRQLIAQELGLAEVLLTPRSQLVGRTIKEAHFRERYGLSVLAIQRMGKPMQGNFLATRLDFGDSLLIGGGWRQIDLLQAEQSDFSVLTIARDGRSGTAARTRALGAGHRCRHAGADDLQRRALGNGRAAGRAGDGSGALRVDGRSLQVDQLAKHHPDCRHAADGHRTQQDRRAGTDDLRPGVQPRRTGATGAVGRSVRSDFDFQSVHLQHRDGGPGGAHCDGRGNKHAALPLPFPDDCCPRRFDSVLDAHGLAGEHPGPRTWRLSIQRLREDGSTSATTGHAADPACRTAIVSPALM
jgi:di/tricarboxylate transporter